MKQCCFELSLQTGCVIAGIIFTLCSLFEIIVVTVIHRDLRLEALIAMDLVLITILVVNNFLLWFGLVTEMKVSILVFIVLMTTYLFIEILSYPLFYITYGREYFGDIKSYWEIGYRAIFCGFLIYFIVLLCSYAMELNSQTVHQHRQRRVLHLARADRTSMLTTLYYGI